jgi:hypothetical protein
MPPTPEPSYPELLARSAADWENLRASDAVQWARDRRRFLADHRLKAIDRPPMLDRKRDDPFYEEARHAATAAYDEYVSVGRRSGLSHSRSELARSTWQTRFQEFWALANSPETPAERAEWEAERRNLESYQSARQQERDSLRFATGYFRPGGTGRKPLPKRRRK